MVFKSKQRECPGHLGRGCVQFSRTQLHIQWNWGRCHVSPWTSLDPGGLEASGMVWGLSRLLDDSWLQHLGFLILFFPDGPEAVMAKTPMPHTHRDKKRWESAQASTICPFICESVVACRSLMWPLMIQKIQVPIRVSVLEIFFRPLQDHAGGTTRASIVPLRSVREDACIHADWMQDASTRQPCTAVT